MEKTEKYIHGVTLRTMTLGETKEFIAALSKYAQAGKMCNDNIDALTESMGAGVSFERPIESITTLELSDIFQEFIKLNPPFIFAVKYFNNVLLHTPLSDLITLSKDNK